MHLSRIAGLKRFVLLLVMTATWSAGTLTLTACSDDADSSVGSIQASIVQATPLRGHAPLEVSFEAVSDDATTDISATWDFGDGSTRTGPATVRYTYQDAGTFEAKVTLTDAEDRAGTDSRLVEVRPTTDLIVSSLQAQPLDLRTGEQLNLQFNLRNDAAQVEFPFNLIVFLTNNRTARYDDQADFVILHSETRETFAGKGEEGDSEDFTLSLGLPVGLPTGSYFLGVMVDPARAIGEIDDNNNILVLEQQVNIENPLTNGPDLVASQIADQPQDAPASSAASPSPPPSATKGCARPPTSATPPSSPRDQTCSTRPKTSSCMEKVHRWPLHGRDLRRRRPRPRQSRRHRARRLLCLS
jgi:PKD repeat protein